MADRGAPRTSIIFICDQFTVPAQQRLWRHDGGHFRQHLPPEQPGFYCQTVALIVGETKLSAAKLSTKDSVFLPQIFDCVLLLLIHPAGDREE